MAIYKKYEKLFVKKSLIAQKDKSVWLKTKKFSIKRKTLRFW